MPPWALWIHHPCTLWPTPHGRLRQIMRNGFLQPPTVTISPSSHRQWVRLRPSTAIMGVRLNQQRPLAPHPGVHASAITLNDQHQKILTTTSFNMGARLNHPCAFELLIVDTGECTFPFSYQETLWVKRRLSYCWMFASASISTPNSRGVIGPTRGLLMIKGTVPIILASLTKATTRDNTTTFDSSSRSSTISGNSDSVKEALLILRFPNGSCTCPRADGLSYSGSIA